MLRGALRPLGGESLLGRAGISPERRAETLTVAEFETLAGTLDASLTLRQAEERS
jgi:16S rRNA (adenine1518-N6/adenine1519-N6)-dimethyltransferase